LQLNIFLKMEEERILSEAERQALKRYHDAELYLPKSKKLSDYWVADFDYNYYSELYPNADPLDALGIYLNELKAWLPRFRAATLLRQEHYERFLKAEDREDSGHRNWRLAMNLVLKDTEDKYAYWSNIWQNKMDDLARTHESKLSAIREIASMKRVDLPKPEKSSTKTETRIKIVQPPPISEKELRKRKEAEKEEREKTDMQALSVALSERVEESETYIQELGWKGKYQVEELKQYRFPLEDVLKIIDTSISAYALGQRLVFKIAYKTMALRFEENDPQTSLFLVTNFLLSKMSEKKFWDYYGEEHDDQIVTLVAALFFLNYESFMLNTTVITRILEVFLLKQIKRKKDFVEQLGAYIYSLFVGFFPSFGVALDQLNKLKVKYKKLLTAPEFAKMKQIIDHLTYYWLVDRYNLLHLLLEFAQSELLRSIQTSDFADFIGAFPQFKEIYQDDPLKQVAVKHRRMVRTAGPELKATKTKFEELKMALRKILPLSSQIPDCSVCNNFALYMDEQSGDFVCSRYCQFISSALK